MLAFRFLSQSKRVASIGTRHFSVSTPSLTVQSDKGQVSIYSRDLAKLLLSNRPDKFQDPALAEATSEESATYGELRERVADLSTQFYIRNWQQDQVIAIFMNSGLPFYITRLAAAQLGITVTIADPTLSAYQLEKQLRDSGASFLITDLSLMPVVREVMASVRSISELFVLKREEDIGVDKEENTKHGMGYLRYTKEVKYELLLAKPPSWGKLPGWEVPLKSPMCIAYYKESIPVGLKFSHENILFALQQIGSQETELTASDVCVSAVPPHDIVGNVVGLDLPLLRGAQCTIVPDNDVDQIANVIKDRSATFLITTSKNFTRLVAIDADLVSLKTIVVTDNEVMLTEDIKNRVSANVKQIITGGLSAPITYGSPDLLPSTEAKTGGSGELLVKGPQFSSEVTKQGSGWEPDAEGFRKVRNLKQFALEEGRLRFSE